MKEIYLCWIGIAVILLGIGLALHFIFDRPKAWITHPIGSYKGEP